MTTSRIPLTIFVGFVVGIAGGLIGLGGAELRLPYLVGVLALAPRAAVPVNLAVSLVTVLAALPVRLARTEWTMLEPWLPVALALTLGAMLAAYVGAGWLRRVPTDVLARVIGALLVALGLMLLAEAALPLVPAGLLPADDATRWTAGALFGLVIGTISSLLGVAGGEVIIPTLVVGYGVPIALAGTLSLMISLPTILVGLARHARAGAFADRAVTRTVDPAARDRRAGGLTHRRRLGKCGACRRHQAGAWRSADLVGVEGVREEALCEAPWTGA